MGAMRLAFVAGLAQFTAFGLAVPMSGDSAPSLFAHGEQTCSNIPSVTAGT